MQITINIDTKRLLAIAVICMVSVGSFFAGALYETHKAGRRAADVKSTDSDPYAAIAKPIKAGDTLIIPESAAADGEVSWCAAHPDTKWTFGPVSAKALKTIQAQLPKVVDVTPVSGVCAPNGGVWTDVVEK